MCDQPVTLAKLSRDRYLALCSCGCLHLVWDHVTIRFHEADLRQVLAQLLSTASEPLAPAGEVQVWLHSAGLKLSPQTFKSLLELLSEAQAALPGKPAVGFEGQRACNPPLRLLN